MPFRIASASGGSGGASESFTPTVTLATPGTFSVTYGAQSGTYVKSGSAYLFTIDLQFTPTIGTGSGAIRIGGLPETAAAASVVTLAGMGDGWQTALDSLKIAGIVRASTTYFEVLATSIGTSDFVVDESSLTGGAAHSLSATGILFT